MQQLNFDYMYELFVQQLKRKYSKRINIIFVVNVMLNKSKMVDYLMVVLSLIFKSYLNIFYDQ